MRSPTCLGDPELIPQSLHLLHNAHHTFPSLNPKPSEGAQGAVFS